MESQAHRKSGNLTQVSSSRVSAHFPCSQPDSGCVRGASHRCRIIESLLVLKSSLHLLSLLTYSHRRSTDERWRATSPVDQTDKICL